MLTLEQLVEIKMLVRQGHFITALARELGLLRNTMRRHLQQEAASSYSLRTPHRCKLKLNRPELRVGLDCCEDETMSKTTTYYLLPTTYSRKPVNIPCACFWST